MSWPALRTAPVVRLGWAFVWAYLVGSGTMVAFVPLVAWLVVQGLEWALPPTPIVHSLSQLGLVDLMTHFAIGISVHLIFSPLLSWIGLLAGVPLTMLALQTGLAGWMVAAAYFGLTALAINIVLMWGNFDQVPPGWLAFAACAGVVLGAAFWLGMRLTAPGLFRAADDRPVDQG